MKSLAMALAISAGPALAVDHGDSPVLLAEPDADIADLFAWTDGSGKVNLVMTWFPNAPTGAQLSDGILYVFHVRSMRAYGAPEPIETRIVCSFDAAQVASCWAGEEDYVTGDARGPEGIASASGRMRVFAGVRNDPSFFNLDGLLGTTNALKRGVRSFSADAAGCPAVDPATSSSLLQQLSARRSDAFAGQNVQALVLQLDPTLVNRGGPILAVSAGTYRKQ